MARCRMRWARWLELMLVLCIAIAAAAPAWSYWSAAATAGGNGAGGAASVNQAATPTAAVVGSTSVAVSWGTSTLSNGRAVGGYLVKRYDASSGAVQTIAAGCAGTVAALTCTETGVPTGQWTYAITPVLANWQGPESLKSGAVTVGSGTITLAKVVFGASPPLPQNTTGSLGGFHVPETVSYKVDTTATSGTTSAVAIDGSATISSLTIPNLADGPHTVYATGTAALSSSQASAGILFDTVAPLVNAQLTPAANAAGWNNTAPVQLALDASDGTGSGISTVKYTTDGSDPKTSGTATSYGPPLSFTTNATIKYYASDKAGNASAVGTQLVRLDAVAPADAVALSSVSGGAYLNGGTVYFRGAAAGSFALTNTVTDSGGSGPASSATSPPAGSATGWSHTASVVSSPSGGPYVSNSFSWLAGTTDSPSETLIARDVAGNSTATALTFSEDSAAPTGGSVDATGLTGTAGRYTRSLALSLAFAKGADTGAGLSAAGAQLLRASAALGSSGGTADGSCGAYGALTQIGSNDPATPLADTVPADNRCYRYEYLVSDSVGNQATYVSPDIKVDTTVPVSLTPVLGAITPVTGAGAQQVTGSTVYYNPAQSGSFTVDATASDAVSGVAAIGFPALAGFAGGGNATSPVTGTTYRTTYTWSGNGVFPSPGSQPLPATNNAGAVTSAAAAFAVVKDTTGPSGGSVDAVGLGGTAARYSRSTTLSIGFAAGSDAGSGVATSGATLWRASAPLASPDGTLNGACGTYGPYTQVGGTGPTTPVIDVVPSAATCYRYQYLTVDRVGNSTTNTTPDIKVDTTPSSAPTLTFSGFSNSYASATTVYYRPGASSGAFTVGAGSSDGDSGIASFAFPAPGAGWTATPGALGVTTYSWAAPNPTAPTGTQNVTATDNAGQASAPAGFTVSADSTAPSGGSVSYTGGYYRSASVDLSFTQGSDGGAGLDAPSGVLQRAAATLSAGSCSTFGAFTTIVSNPTSPTTDTSVSSGSCYQYRYAVSDKVGNQAIYTSSNVAKIDGQPPTHSLSLTAAVDAYLSGSALYYKGNAAGSFKLVDALSDALSGPASATYAAIATSGWTHGAETISTPAGGPFTSSTFGWTANPTQLSSLTVTGADNGGNTASTALTVTSDTTLPVSGSVSYANGIVSTLSVAITTTNGSDSQSGVNAASAVVKRDETTLNTTTETCATFPGTFATTVTLVGGADTSVTTAHCYKYHLLISDNVGNQATYSSANVAKVDATAVLATAIASQESSGAAGNGQLEVGDKLILTFSQNLATASVPTTFTGATETRTGSQTVKLTVPGISNGAEDTGSALYFAGASGKGTATFNGNVVLVNNGSATTITIAVTTLSVTNGALAASSGILTFGPASTITDLGGTHAASGTLATTSAFKLF